MGRNRKKGGGAGAVEPTGGGAGVVPAPEAPEAAAVPITPPEEETIIPPRRRRRVPEQADADQARRIFGDAIFDRGIPRQLEAGGMRDAWDGTPASTLRGVLVDGPVAPAITAMYSLPTAREYFDIPSPERSGLTPARVTELAGAIGQSDIIANGGSYDDLLDSLGVRGLPQATSPRLRVGEDTQAMVTRVAKATDELGAGLTPNQRAQVGALLDTLGGLSLTRERAWETMILTRGRETPKGQVMGEAVKRVLGEARRIANEINRIHGVTKPPRKDGIPAPGTPGALAYAALMTDPGGGHDWRARNHKAPLYANRGLENVNND